MNVKLVCPRDGDGDGNRRIFTKLLVFEEELDWEVGSRTRCLIEDEVATKQRLIHLLENLHNSNSMSKVEGRLEGLNWYGKKYNWDFLAQEMIWRKQIF